MVANFKDWWVVGTGLANALGVPRTTLISAVEAGHLRWRLLGSGEPVVRLDDAKKWAEGRR